jgi:hypothetical protein
MFVEAAVTWLGPSVVATPQIHNSDRGRRGFRFVNSRVASLCAAHSCLQLVAVAGRYGTSGRVGLAATGLLAKQAPRGRDVAGF